MHRFFQIIVVVLAISQFGSPSHGQERRRQFVQDLLKTLIDNQLPDEQPTRNVPGRSTPQPRANTNRAVVDRNLTPELREAGRLLTAASNEMSLLVGALQTDIFRAQGVRQLLSLAMNVNADAAVLSRRLSRAHDVEALRDSLRQLDQQWRTLDYQLSQTRNLSPQTLGHIEKIRRYEDQLTAMFQVTPQVDITEISRQAVAIGNTLKRLIEDIPYEVTNRTLASRLDAEGRGMFESVRRFVQLMQTAPPFESLRAEFETVERQWQNYKNRLRRANSSYIQRQSQKIETSVRAIHEMFWLKQSVNYEDLLQTTRLLQRDTHQFLDRVTLSMLVDLPAARQFALPSAADFDTACHDLEDVIVARDDIEVIQELFLFAHDEWSRLNIALQGVSDQTVRQNMREIQQSMLNLKNQLGVRPDFDRQEAIELASIVTGMAQHVQSDVRDVFGRPNRYPRQFQTESLEAASQFRTAAQRLHDGLVSGDKLRQVKVNCAGMSDAWEQLGRFVPRFELAEQQRLGQIRRDVTPKVVQLQTLLAL